MVERVVVPHLAVEVAAERLAGRSGLVAQRLAQLERPLACPLSLDLPAWVTKPLFENYLCGASVVAAVTAVSALDLLRLSVLLQDAALQDDILRSQKLQSFAPDSALIAYSLAAEHETDSREWTAFFHRSLQYIRSNIAIVLERSNHALRQVPKEALERVLVESLKTDFGRQVSDPSPVIHCLKSLWGCGNLTEMLEQAAASIKPPSTPCLQWQIDLLANRTLQFSPEFEIGGISWQLQAWYQSREDRLDCYLASGVGERQHIAGALVAANVLLEVLPGECFKQPRLVTLLLGSKGQKLLRTIYGLRTRLPSPCATLCVSMQIEHCFAALLTYMSSHFEDPQVSEKIGRLSGERLQQLLAMKQLNVASEDSVLRVIGLWSDRHCNEDDAELELNSLLEAVKWPGVSTRQIIDCCRLFPMLKTNPVFRTNMQQEFVYRSKIRERRDAVDPRAYTTSQPQNDTNFSVFISGLCSALVSFDYTRTICDSEIQAVKDLTAVLRTKEREAKLLRDSLQTIRSVLGSSSSSPALSLMNTQHSDSKKEEEGGSYKREPHRTHSDALSTAAAKSSRQPPSPLDNSGEVLDVKVTNLLASFWSKVEEKAKGVSGGEESI